MTPSREVPAIVSSVTSGVSVEERATKLLLQTSKVIGQGDQVMAEAEERFSEMFFDTMDTALVDDMRTVFGLSVDGASGCLDALAIDADA
jgi:hypothetical protein